ncbi:MAG TPA: hypothetical protein VJN43_18615 [Bryobacteraceae bacterium]|nr:hypothetical protein [Bryobacteraceae bacterium]
MQRLLFIPFFLLAACVAYAAGPAASGPEWRQLYFYDEVKTSLVINDFQFATATHGVAVGMLVDVKGKIKPAVLTSDDGGAHWTIEAFHEVPLSLFMLDSNQGWIVGDKSIWQTADGGRNWRKLAKLDDAVRVYFLTGEHGWAVGEEKKVYETIDGGKEWREVPAAAKPESTPERTVYNWIDFEGTKAGIITGWNQPVKHENTGVPEWMNPAATRFERETPRVSIFLQTRDGGKTWDASTGSIFGHVSCVRLSPAGFGLGLIEFGGAFEWPSEVFRIDSSTGKSERVFREKNRLITDIAIPRTGPAYLAGIEKLDKLSENPIPGKLKVLRSDDLAGWHEMTVDYRATAHRAMISAVDDRNIWVATDTGMILKLAASR